MTYQRKTVDAPVLPKVIATPPWVNLISDLVKRRIPKKQIAERCDMARETLYSIWEGKQPSWRQGQLLLELHRRAVPSENMCAEMRRYYGTTNGL